VYLKLEGKKHHMKKLTLLSIALVIFLMTGCKLIGSIDTGNKLKGSGVNKSEKRSVAPFTALDISCSGSIQVLAQGKESVEISGDDNIVGLITTEVKNDTLYIKTTKEYDSKSKLQIKISVPDLKKFVFAGAGEGNLENVKNNRTEIALTGAGSLNVSGETKEAEITLSGAGSIDAKNLHALTAKVTSNGVGQVEVYATEQLDAKASGVGEINYYGNPKVVNKDAKGIGGINEK
jgi:hypothetical protein